jgi:hypothetical protein
MKNRLQKTNVFEQQLNNLLANKEFVTFKYIRCAFYLIEDIWNVMNLFAGILTSNFEDFQKFESVKDSKANLSLPCKRSILYYKHEFTASLQM